MLDFPDPPYTFIPPRPSLAMLHAARLANRLWRLPRVLALDGVRVEGRLPGAGDGSLLLLPNHPTHGDAAIMIEAGRQLGLWPRFMAAYEVFHRGRADRFVMQRLGAFSVDRDAADRESLACATGILEAPPPAAGPRPALVVFPEGNVFLRTDQPAPFQEGAAFLAVKAAAARPVLVVPVAIKLACTDPAAARAEVERRTARLESLLKLKADGHPAQRLEAIGRAALRHNLVARGLACPDGADLAATLQAAGAAVLDGLARKIGQPLRGDTLLERVRAARRLVHEVRSDPERVHEHRGAAVWADEALLAFRIATYAGDYLGPDPAVERLVETAEKLEEDVTDRWPKPVAQRRVEVRLGEPLDARAALAAARRPREAARELTAQVEAQVRGMLGA